MVIDPKNSNILYLATWDGVFKSINGGESWFQDYNGLKTILIYTIEIDIKNPNVLYLGTEYGIYKTVNGGEEWIEINDSLYELKSLCLIDDMVIYDIAINRDDNNIIYVSTSINGVLKSKDGGKNFVLINKGLTDLSARRLFIYRVNSKIIYLYTLSGDILNILSHVPSKQKQMREEK